jgi:hypothetical protein
MISYYQWLDFAYLDFKDPLNKINIILGGGLKDFICP